MTDFNALCAQLRTMKAAGLQDTPTYERLANLALQNAPDWLMTEIINDAVKAGMLPPAMGMDERGERVWRLEDVAKHMGLSEADMKASLERFQLEHGDFQSLDPDSINRIH
jgi:hypothetical protein